MLCAAAAGTVLALVPPEREPVANMYIDQCREALAARYDVTGWNRDEQVTSSQGVERLEYIGTVLVGTDVRDYHCSIDPDPEIGAVADLRP